MGLLADIGIPMISIVLPAAWLLLVPVIFLEALVGVHITKLPFRRIAAAATAANLFSTILGIPLAWFVLAIVEGIFFGTAKGLDSFWGKVYAVTIQAPWLNPYEKDLDWMIPIALIVLAVPLWVMSVVTEYYIVRRMLPELPPALKWQWMWKANVVSYILLLAVIFASLLLGPVVGWFYSVVEPVTDFLTRSVIRIGQLMSNRGP
jgi:hypothetical protein